VPGVDVNPVLSVTWLRRAVELHRHIAATYELAVAMYTGEGTAVNPETAVKLYLQAANLGHAGAAYMVGECLLDGAGTARDRANALEWLVTAAELGHKKARYRVLVVLYQVHKDVDSKEHKIEEPGDEETSKWTKDGPDVIALERRHTIGLEPHMIRRMTQVMESRDQEDQEDS
jgi:TPR repeat protein